MENCESKDSPNSDRGQFEESTDSTNEDSLSNMNPETSPAQGPTLPMLQKLINLSNSIQHLKKEHEILFTQLESSPDHDMLRTLQLLNDKHELLKKKYLDESSERKRLYNEVIELKGNIRVFCRYRPLNQAEIVNDSSCIIELDSSQHTELHIVSSDSSKKQFKFDHVFRAEDGQEAIFAQTKPIVTSVLDGYNACIFAYGQTGTGKTYTMEGTPDNMGVNYRTLEELFKVSGERSDVMKYELFVRMMEVYNEKIKDLLGENSNQPTKRLEIKESAEGTPEVPGLFETRVYNTKHAWKLLKSGSQVRSVGATNANDLSSRTHCLLHVTVRGTDLIDGQNTSSNLWLVDLAGSEYVGKTEVEGERLKESQFINKSLSALGDVISALASKTGHIPYRNSKLTHMLQSSLGGDCKTVMFVQISPSKSDLGETLCSLNFASRVRGIENGPACKLVDLAELHKYKQMAEKLKRYEETKKLQDDVQSLQLRLSDRVHTCKNLEEKVHDLENQLVEEWKTQLKRETNDEELLIKKYVDELSERKRLYNEAIELEGNIRVFCRCSPLNDAEFANRPTSLLELESTHGTDLVIFAPDSSNWHFKFHHVFMAEDGQEAVFARTKPFVISALDGYNVCIFSYGLTGSRKTFTLEGTPDNWGVNYRILKELFQLYREKNVVQYELFVSMMEVYNEKIKDLLGENSNQPTKRIKQEAEGIRVQDMKDVELLMSHGATKANKSHRLLRVSINGLNLISKEKTKSHMWLVDLAGRGPAEVERDKSLSVLGDVISSLLSKTNDLRFSDSKLTHLLQSSLGGDCKTLMFVQISPYTADFQESLTTLNFAEQVQTIKNSTARKQAELAEAERRKKEKFSQLREEYPKFREIEVRAQQGLASLVGGFLVVMVSLVMSIYGSAWFMTELFCPHHIVTSIPMHISFVFTIIFVGFLFWRFAEGYRKELGSQISTPMELERITREMTTFVGDNEDRDRKKMHAVAEQSIWYYNSLRTINILILVCYGTLLVLTLVTLQAISQPKCPPIPLEPMPAETQASTDMQGRLIRQSVGRPSGVPRRIRLQLYRLPPPSLFYGNDTMFWF